jgi:hypothetical protein
LIIGTLGVKNTQRIVESDFLLFNKNPQTWTERMEEAKMKLGVKPTELTTTTLDNEVLRNKVLENIKKTFREAKVFFNDVQFPIDIENITIQKNADGTYKLSLPAIDGSLFKEIDNLSSLAKVTIKRKLEKQADGTYQE